MSRDFLLAKMKYYGINLIKKNYGELKSGVSSDYYIDVKEAYGHPALLELLADRIHDKFGEDVRCVARCGVGGIPLVTSIGARYKHNCAFVRENEKSWGRNNLIDGYVPSKGERVAIVDDVLTSGGSLKKIIEIIERTGAVVEGGYVIVDRSNGGIDIFGKKIESLYKVKDLLIN